MHLWSASFHTITGISIAGNIYRVIRNEQRITQFVLPHWIQMHKRRLFTDLLQSWYALATQTQQGAPRYRLRKHGARKKGVSNQRQSSWQPSTRKDCISSAFRWCPPPRGSIAQRSQRSSMSISSTFEYKHANRDKKTIVNIVKSSVKHNKTYWSKLWVGSDTHLIRIWY